MFIQYVYVEDEILMIENGSYKKSNKMCYL